jgi:hypothetical protein
MTGAGGGAATTVVSFTDWVESLASAFPLPPQEVSTCRAGMIKAALKMLLEYIGFLFFI